MRALIAQSVLLLAAAIALVFRLCYNACFVAVINMPVPYSISSAMLSTDVLKTRSTAPL